MENRSTARSRSASRRAAACCARFFTTASTPTSRLAAYSTACWRTSPAAPAAASTCVSRSRRARARATSIRTKSSRSATLLRPIASAAHSSPTACSSVCPQIPSRESSTRTRRTSTGAAPPRVGDGRLAGNPNAYSWFMRSLLLKLDAWVARGAPPPASVYPTFADKTLVERSALHFPRIPGVQVPVSLNGPVRLDFGPGLARGGNGVATIEPPKVGQPYPILLPQVDTDGNELAGLRSPELAVPLATYMGWQLYKPELGRPEELVSLQGSFAPFPLDTAERVRTGDPRRAILERYPNRESYLALVEQIAKFLATDGYLRTEDLPQIVAQAGERWRVLVDERAKR